MPSYSTWCKGREATLVTETNMIVTKGRGLAFIALVSLSCLAFRISLATSRSVYLGTCGEDRRTRGREEGGKESTFDTCSFHTCKHQSLSTLCQRPANTTPITTVQWKVFAVFMVDWQTAKLNPQNKSLLAQSFLALGTFSLKLVPTKIITTTYRL